VYIKEPKKIYSRGINGSFIDVLSTFKKRIGAKKLFERYTTYEGVQGTEENWRQAARILVDSQSDIRKSLEVLGLKRDTPNLKRFKRLLESST